MNVKMKIVFKLVVCLLFSFGTSYGQKVDSNKPMEVYLLIGQSNMAGRSTLDGQSQTTSENILMLDKTNNWVLTIDPLHFDRSSAGVGPGLSFAQAMLEGHKKTKIGLIPCAWGGSPVKVWTPGAKYFDDFPYERLLHELK
jgi:hypothetical protein